MPGQANEPHWPLSRQLWTLPNLLTYVRLAGVPLFVAAYRSGQAELALAFFVLASVTDGLDGLLARLLRQRTPLGMVLDPIADKLLTLTAFATLTWYGRLPPWLLGLVLFRDVPIAAAVASLRWTGRVSTGRPTRLGKYSTVLLLLTVALALVNEVANDPLVRSYLIAAAMLAIPCVVLTVVQYFVRWRRLMRLPPPAAPPPVPLWSRPLRPAG